MKAVNCPLVLIRKKIEDRLIITPLEIMTVNKNNSKIKISKSANYKIDLTRLTQYLANDMYITFMITNEESLHANYEFVFIKTPSRCKRRLCKAQLLQSDFYASMIAYIIFFIVSSLFNKKVKKYYKVIISFTFSFQQNITYLNDKIEVDKTYELGLISYHKNALNK